MPDVAITVRGAVAELAEALSGPGPHPTEVLIDGPANAAKSFSVCGLLYWIAHAWPGARMLAVRKTRASLTESFCVTWEKAVPHEDELEGPSKEHRHSYRWTNGSELVLGGMDQPTRLYSTEWDVVFVEEAGELVEDEWERFLRSLRNQTTPFQLLLGATNPYWPTHWLNIRCNAGKTLRLFARHEDNPALHDGQNWTAWGRRAIEILDGLTGVRKERLRFGRWVAAEGLVWEPFDPAVHEITAQIVREKEGKNGLMRRGLWLRCASWPEDREVRWVAAGMDFGHTAPGALGVYGVDSETRAYLLAEIYHGAKSLDWWAERVVELHREFDLRVIVADPSRPAEIEQLNTRLGEACGRSAGSLVIGADNRLTSKSKGDMAGLDLVRWAMKPGPDREPLIYFLRNSLRHGPDPELREKSKPWCTVHEIPAYTFLKARDDKLGDARAEKDERPDPACADHGCDQLRYFAAYAWQRDLTAPPEKPRFEPWSFGDIMKHDPLDGPQ